MAGDPLPAAGLLPLIVSIHARTWRATQNRLRCHCRRPGFNPRPHMAGDHATTYGLRRFGSVSIHARTWRATGAIKGLNHRTDVSIHARTWRATRWQKGDVDLIRFNPRPHMAGDNRRDRALGQAYVSIHARTWRATAAVGERGLFRQRFNPPPHMAGDSKAADNGRTRKSFNPRPHMAGDAGKRRPRHSAGVSIHARTWRATVYQVSHDRGRLCFNPRPHMAGDYSVTTVQGTLRCFNPRPHMAGDRPLQRVQAGEASFNPRPHMAGDPADTEPRRMGDVSIHARTWRATAELLPRIDESRFNPRPHMAGDSDSSPAGSRGNRFNPRPHMAGDHSDTRLRGSAGVSIHARTWRATLGAGPTTTPSKFQSTPAHGGRPFAERKATAQPCFNPRPHMAGDEPWPNCPTERYVSIHARTWRATWSASAGSRRPGGFNPRPHMAGDRLIYLSNSQAWFQSTPAHGGRPRRSTPGADRLVVSIHARTWRATSPCRWSRHRSLVSIHARTWRATQYPVPSQTGDLVSIHARTWRATRVAAIVVLAELVSIHARTWRATGLPRATAIASSVFQSTPAHGGRRRRP